MMLVCNRTESCQLECFETDELETASVSITNNASTQSRSRVRRIDMEATLYRLKKEKKEKVT